MPLKKIVPRLADPGFEVGLGVVGVVVVGVVEVGVVEVGVVEVGVVEVGVVEVGVVEVGVVEVGVVVEGGSTFLVGFFFLLFLMLVLALLLALLLAFREAALWGVDFAWTAAVAWFTANSSERVRTERKASTFRTRRWLRRL